MHKQVCRKRHNTSKPIVPPCVVVKIIRGWMRFGSSINDVTCFSYLFDPLSPMSPLFYYYASSIHPHFSTNPPPYLKKYCDIIYGRSFWGMRMCLVSCKSLGNTYFQVSLSKIETRQYKRKSTSLTKMFSNFSHMFLNPNKFFPIWILIVLIY